MNEWENAKKHNTVNQADVPIKFQIAAIRLSEAAGPRQLCWCSSGAASDVYRGADVAVFQSNLIHGHGNLNFVQCSLPYTIILPLIF